MKLLNLKNLNHAWIIYYLFLFFLIVGSNHSISSKTTGQTKNQTFQQLSKEEINGKSSINKEQNVINVFQEKPLLHQEIQSIPSLLIDPTLNDQIHLQHTSQLSDKDQKKISDQKQSSFPNFYLYSGILSLLFVGCAILLIIQFVQNKSCEDIDYYAKWNWEVPMENEKKEIKEKQKKKQTQDKKDKKRKKDN